MTRSAYAMCVGLVLSATAAPLSAQAGVGSFVHVGVMGGATVPTSYLSDIAKSGWNVGAFVAFGAPLSPLSFRFEAQIHQLGGKPFESSTTFNRVGASASLVPADVRITHQYGVRIIDGTANVLYTFPSKSPAKF